MSSEARSLPEPSQRMRAAREAVAVVEHALVGYPAEEALIESRDILSELAVSIMIANTVEEAERVARHGDISAARELYQDALSYLGHENVHIPDRERAAVRIREAIDRLPFSPDNR